MRVAFLHPELGLGGAERLVVGAAAALQRAGHCTAIFTTRHDPRRAFDEIRTAGLDVRVHGRHVPVHVGGRLVAPCAIARMASLGAALARCRTRFDVAVCDLVPHAIPLVRCLTGLPVVYYCHFPDVLLTRRRRSAAYRCYRRPLDGLEARGLAAADGILANSHFTTERLVETFPRRRHVPQVVHPAVDVETYAGVPPVASDGEGEALAVLCIGRLVPEKNLTLAVAALAALPRHLPAEHARRVRLVIAGGYDDRRRECRDTLRAVESLARRMGVAERVEICRSLSDAERLHWLARSRCVMHPAAGEHFGFAPLEAMAAGRPVVAVDAGGVRETVQHGITGLLCPPEPAAFARALAALLGDAATARRMGEAGRQRAAQEFSWPVFAARLELALRDVIGDRIMADQ